MATLPHKVHDRPMVFTALKMIERQVGKLTSPQPTSQQYRQEGTVTFPFQSLGVWKL